jgi:hypothetical protein
MKQNTGFKVMCDISCVLEGEGQVDFEDLRDLSVSDIECYKCDILRFPW